MSCWVPVSVADRLCAVAAQQGLSVSQTASRILIMGLRHAPPDPPKTPPE